LSYVQLRDILRQKFRLQKQPLSLAALRIFKMKTQDNRLSGFICNHLNRTIRPFHALVFVLCLLAATPVQAAEQSITISRLKVTVWSKSTDKAIKQPIIIFSHGFHGCATQSRFLMEAFASAGYIVFAPNHRDATCNSGHASLVDSPETPFRDPASWSENSYLDRAEDIWHLIDALHADETYQKRLDWSRLALAGHSLGGYVVLGLAGAWASWKMDSIKAVLALSPYSQPFIVHKTLGRLSAPVMYQGGTLDFDITPSLQKASGSYDLSPAPKYLVEFSKASHLAWTDIGIVAHDAISYYSLAFMDHYVKGEPDEKRLKSMQPGVAMYRYSSEFGNNTEAAVQK
jgi:pimeloyl-ACP methyl ester carboxylesterase